MNTPSESEMESMNDDLDEFSQDYEESKHEDEDTEYEDDLIESNRKMAQPSSRMSRLAGVSSRLTDSQHANEILDNVEKVSPNRRLTKGMQPSKMFETSPIISAA